jgi:hypothetical protein
MFIGVLAVVGFGYVQYWQHKLQPIVSAPGVNLDVGAFAPVAVAKTRWLNLGYARVLVPESIGGELVHMASSNFICMGAGAAYPITFCPPRSSRDPEVVSFLHDTAAFSGEPVKSWFEFEKLEIAQKPFTVWMLPSLGRRKAAAKATLLMLKSLECSKTSSIQTFETDRSGIIIWRQPEFTRVLIGDFKSGISQEILIAPSVANADEIISTIASSYELGLTDVDTNSLERLIDGAGLRIVSATAPPTAVQMAHHQ